MNSSLSHQLRIAMGKPRAKRATSSGEPDGAQGTEGAQTLSQAGSNVAKRERSRKAMIILCQSGLMGLTYYYKAPGNTFFPGMGALFSVCALLAYMPWGTMSHVAFRVASATQVRAYCHRLRHANDNADYALPYCRPCCRLCNS